MPNTIEADEIPRNANHERIGGLALALGLAGRRDQAVAMLQRLTDLASRS
jgi:hypothetical protein